jgi:hypothetical protein
MPDDVVYRGSLLKHERVVVRRDVRVSLTGLRGGGGHLHPSRILRDPGLAREGVVLRIKHSMEARRSMESCWLAPTGPRLYG